MRYKQHICLSLALVVALPTPLLAADGRVNVKISPEDAKFDRARWKINDNLPIPPIIDPTNPNVPSGPVIDHPITTTWRRSDVSLDGVPDGLHIVEFEDISGHSPCVRPASALIEVRTALPTFTEGKYVCGGDRLKAQNKAQQAPMGITVTISPAKAVSGGAAWRIKGETTWRPNGSTFSVPTDGANIVQYKDVSSGTCTITPADEVVDYYSGQTVEWNGQPYAGTGC